MTARSRQELQCLLGIAIIACASTTAARELRRGPYLQVPTPHGITIRWRTDKSVQGAAIVRYGRSPYRLDHAVAARLENTHFENAMEWEAEIDALESETQYFYSIEVDQVTLAGADQRHFFRTSPEIGSTRKLRFLFLGDSGPNRPRETQTADALELKGPISSVAVRNGWRQFLSRNKFGLDGIVLLGDNAYPTGTDVQWQTAFFQLYDDELRNTPVWPCTGNHDMNDVMRFLFSVNADGSAGGVPSQHPLYYSADIGNVHLVVLDPWKQWLETTQESDHHAWVDQLSWLEKDLAATRQDWIVMVNHFPVYCDGNYQSDQQGVLSKLREVLVPLCDKHGVDFFLAGHDHTYQRSYLIRNHLGPSSTLRENNFLSKRDGRNLPIEKGHGPGSGTFYIVSGTGGGSRPTGRFQHPVMIPMANGKRGIADPGALILEFEGLLVRGFNITASGQPSDSFAISKSRSAAVD